MSFNKTKSLRRNIYKEKKNNCDFCYLVIFTSRVLFRISLFVIFLYIDLCFVGDLLLITNAKHVERLLLLFFFLFLYFNSFFFFFFLVSRKSYPQVGGMIFSKAYNRNGEDF